MKYTREIETLRRQVRDAFPPPAHYRVGVNIHQPIKTGQGEYTGEFRPAAQVPVVEFDAYMGAIPRQENYKEYDLSRAEYEALVRRVEQ